MVTFSKQYCSTQYFHNLTDPFDQENILGKQPILDLVDRQEKKKVGLKRVEREPFHFACFYTISSKTGGIQYWKKCDWLSSSFSRYFLQKNDYIIVVMTLSVPKVKKEVRIKKKFELKKKTCSTLVDSQLKMMSLLRDKHRLPPIKKILLLMIRIPLIIRVEPHYEILKRYQKVSLCYLGLSSWLPLLHILSRNEKRWKGL